MLVEAETAAEKAASLVFLDLCCAIGESVETVRYLPDCAVQKAKRQSRLQTRLPNCRQSGDESRS
jgi:hypothetical protein